MIIYTYKNCGSCKKATNWLKAQGIAFDEKPIRETPPTVAELQQMLGYQNGDLKKLFNTAGGDYRELDMKTKLPKMPEAEALDLLASRGNLVKRPFVLGNGFGLVGFKEADWAKVIQPLYLLLAKPPLT
jgi:arsenate reductase